MKMTARHYRHLKIAFAILTCILIGLVYVLPAKKISILKEVTENKTLFGFEDPGRENFFGWLDSQYTHWYCNYAEGNEWGCGMDMILEDKPGIGIDLSRYDKIELDVDYEGDGPYLRLYIRNFNGEYSSIGDVASSKHMSMLFETWEAKQQTVKIDLSELTVSKWWVVEKNIQREHALPEFNNVTHIGLEVINSGNHKIKIKKLVLTKSWLGRDETFLGIICFWMILILCEACVKFSLLGRAFKRNKQQVGALQIKQDILALENEVLEEIANKDSLTGIYNRAGLMEKMESILGAKEANEQLGLMVLDLDHFKNVNDTYGHDYGDLALKNFASGITDNARDQDVFARWGGEEFVFLCQVGSEGKLKSLAEKLRGATEQTSISKKEANYITVSIGVTLLRENEDFNSAFKRADDAMYKAKNNGRNRIEFEE